MSETAQVGISSLWGLWVILAGAVAAALAYACFAIATRRPEQRRAIVERAPKVHELLPIPEASFRRSRELWSRGRAATRLDSASGGKLGPGGALTLVTLCLRLRMCALDAIDGVACSNLCDFCRAVERWFAQAQAAQLAMPVLLTVRTTITSQLFTGCMQQ